MGWDAEAPEHGDGGHLTREERRYWRDNDNMMRWWSGCVTALVIIMPGLYLMMIPKLNQNI